MYKRTLRILCGGSGRRLPRRAALNAVERMLLAAAMSNCSVLGRLLRYVQMTARTCRAVAIAASVCADPDAGRVELPSISDCCGLQPMSSCSICGGSILSRSLICFLSFASFVNGLRPMSHLR